METDISGTFRSFGYLPSASYLVNEAAEGPVRMIQDVEQQLCCGVRPQCPQSRGCVVNFCRVALTFSAHDHTDVYKAFHNEVRHCTWGKERRSELRKLLCLHRMKG